MNCKKYIFLCLFCIFLYATPSFSKMTTVYEQVLNCVEKRDIEHLKLLVGMGKDVDAVNTFNETALCRSIRKRDYAGYEMLVTQGANENHVCVQHISPYVRNVFFRTKPATGTYFKGSMETAAPVATGIVRQTPVAQTKKVKTTPTSAKKVVKEEKSNRWLYWTSLALAAGGVGALAGGGGGGGGGGAGENNPLQCQNGYIYNEVTAACEPRCAANQFWSGTSCRSCPLNASSPAGATACTCNSGYKNLAGVCLRSVPKHEDAEYNKSQVLKYVNASSAYDYIDKNGGIDNLTPVPVVVLDTIGTGVVHRDINYATDSSGNIIQIGLPTTKNLENGVDTTYHGMAVAGVIAGKWNDFVSKGIAPNAQIISMHYDTMSSTFYLQQAANAGARVLNFSMGYGAFQKDSLADAKETLSHYTSWINFARTAKQNDIVIVQAAGNDGWEYPQFMAATNDWIPGLYITAVALDTTGSLAYYSNACGWAGEYCLGAVVGAYAPAIQVTGTNANGIVTSYNEGYVSGFNGTSCAAPIISGGAALLMGQWPSLTGPQAVDILLKTAQGMGTCTGKRGDTCIDETYGRGMMDLEAAFSPVGRTTVPLGNSPQENSIAFQNTRLTLPALYANQIQQELPEKITVLDDYNRDFNLSTADFIKKTNSSYHHYERQFKSFAMAPIHTKSMGGGFSFKFIPAPVYANAGNTGAFEMKSDTQRLSTTLFYYSDTYMQKGTFYDQALLNPFTEMERAYGFDSTYKMTPKMNFSVGFSFGENGLYDGDYEKDYDYTGIMSAVQVGMRYDFNNRLQFNTVTGLTWEQGATLGLNGSGAFDTDTANTYFMGVGLTYKPFEKWALSGQYYYGVTNGSMANTELSSLSTINTASFALDARYHHSLTQLFGVQLLQPLRIQGGRLNLNLPIGMDSTGNTIYRFNKDISLKPTAHETDIYAYWQYTAGNNMYLKAKTGLRINPEHQQAKPDYQTMIGFGINF